MDTTSKDGSSARTSRPATMVILILAGVCATVAGMHAAWPLTFDYLACVLFVLPAAVAIIPYVAEIEFPGFKLKTRELEKRLDEQWEIIKRLFPFTMHEHIFRHLRELYERQFNGLGARYNIDDGMRTDLKTLISHNYLNYFPVDGTPNGDDIASKRLLTEYGQMFVELREPTLKAASRSNTLAR